MCGVIVVDAKSFWSTWHGRDAYIHDHCLRYCHLMRSAVNCSAVICSPTVIFSILREASSETYGPRVYFQSYNLLFFHHTSFWSIILVSYLLSLQSFTFYSINQKYQKYYFTVYPSLSDLTLRITVKGLITPLSRWLQVGVCLCRYSMACCVVYYWIDTLVLKTKGNTYSTLLHHPFLFKGKTNASSRSSML